MGHIIGSTILIIVAVACFIISYLQFNEKGYLFNNAYIYASKQERETMDKQPHYKQSGVVFLLLGLILVLNAADCILHTAWIVYCVIALVLAVIVYAIISSVKIEKSKS